MAHQATAGTHVELLNRRLLKRPELAALIGVIASQWAELESDLTFLYATLLGKYLPHIQEDGPPTHPIGFQIFDALENLHKRTQLIERLAEELIVNEDLVKELKDVLLPLIKNAGRRRNDLIHAYWGTNDNYPDALIRISVSEPWMIYKASDFNEAIDLIIRSSNAITDFEVKVKEFLKGTEQPY